MSAIIKNNTMSSREIAHITGKPHNDVLKSIRSMERAWEKVNGGKFSLVEYTDKKGEKRPEYRLNKMEYLYIATKFNDEARAKLVIRWVELEEKSILHIPTPKIFNEVRCVHYMSWLLRNGYSLMSGQVRARIKKYPEQFRKTDEGWYMSEAIAEYFLNFKNPQQRISELPSVNPKQLNLFSPKEFEIMGNGNC